MFVQLHEAEFQHVPLEVRGVLQDLFQGLLNTKMVEDSFKHLQGVADAERSSTPSSSIGPRKRVLEEKELANPKTRLRETKFPTAGGNTNSDAVTEKGSSDITGYNYPMCGHVE